ncbi:hypothetical protein TD95_002381, partial [Thielaviopsis punctulata]
VIPEITYQRLGRPILGDKQYHRIFESLFQCIIIEREQSMRKALSTANAATLRLGKSAKAVRLTYEHAAGTLKRKTVLAVIDHITQMLQSSEGTLIPLPNMVSEYLRTLVGILSNPATVEQLTREAGEGWSTCMDFCVDVINKSLEEFQSNPEGSPHPSSSLGGNSSLHSPHGSRMSLKWMGISFTDLQLILECMHHLVLAPTAHIRLLLTGIIKAITQIVQHHNLAVGRTPQYVFGTLSVTMMRIQADDIVSARVVTEKVLPHLRYWWQPDKPEKEETVKSSRDEILKTLFLMQPYLEKISKENPPPEFSADIEDLLDTLWTEYSRREERSRLQLQDISFGSVKPAAYDFQTPLFSLYYRGLGEDRSWATLECLAFLEEVFYHISKSLGSEEITSQEPQHKRRRLVDYNRLHQRLKTPDLGIQTTALQLVSFLAQSTVFSDEDIWSLLNDCSNLVSHKSFTTASWALVACSSCAFREGASDSPLYPTWKNLWNSAARVVSIPGVCRASSVMLHTILQLNLVPYHNISGEITRIITNPDFSGPAVVVDSSLLLMLHVLHLRNSKVPNASGTTSSHVIRWVFLKWHPDDMAYASLHSVHASPLDIGNLLLAACGLDPIAENMLSNSIGGPLGLAWREKCSIQSTTRFLNLLDEPSVKSTRFDLNAKHSLSSISHPSDIETSHASRMLIVELFGYKIASLQDMVNLWNKRVAHGGQLIHSEKVQSMFSACIVLALMFPLFKELSKTRDVKDALDNLLQSSFATITTAMDRRRFLNVLLRTIRPYIPDISVTTFQDISEKQPQLLILLEHLERAVKQAYADTENKRSQDEMDLDDDFDTQRSNIDSNVEEVVAPRRWSAIEFRETSFMIDTEVRLELVYLCSQKPEKSQSICSKFVNYFVSLPESSILASQNSLIDLLKSDVAMQSRDLVSILERVGGIMSQPAYEFCEAALIACIETMNSLLPVWKSDDSELSNMAGDIYFHIVKNGLKMNFLSSRAKTSLVNLLLNILREVPDYADHLRLPSCQSTLLQIAQSGNMEVKFYVGKRLPEMFGFYILKLHDEIFLDILDTLPQNIEEIEGIAYRLYVLSELACHWPTLLRRSIYHIFETPGIIPSSADYAERGLKTVAKMLKLESPQELFRLFSPQILYTWVPANSFDNIPFSIFGFNSLHSLLMTGREEASAILIMRGESAMFEDLAMRLNMAPAQLIKENFGKIIAYSIAYGVAKQKARVENATLGPGGPQLLSIGEHYMHQVLGTEAFSNCVYTNFADAVSTFIDAYEPEEPSGRSFSAADEYPAEIMSEILAYSHSEVLLPPKQQPFFKGKYLTKQLKHLCLLMPKSDIVKMWTSPLVTYVARKLVNTVHKSLGSLNACSVVRRLRGLVCLSGQVALVSYTVEMILSCLRPFIVDPDCADDVIGLVQYLLVKGTPYLKTVPSFVAGYGLSTLASLRVFLESSQTSTTQENDFKMTMGKVQEFHAWLSQYLKNYISTGEFSDRVQQEAFRSITESAAHIRSSGNAEKGTYESNLLIEILRDKQRKRQLLSEPARNLALALLCGDFELPDSSDMDIISEDSDAVKLSTVVWETCKSSSLSKGYLSWAGRVVGRAFAASGSIPERFLYESRLPEYSRIFPDNGGSHEYLIMLFIELCGSEDSVTAGLAEGAIRQMVSEIVANPEKSLDRACQRTLTESILTSSHWDDQHPPLSEIAPTNPKLDHSVLLSGAIEEPDWVQRMVTYLCLTTPSRAIISCAGPAVQHVRGFAEQVFPFILHLTLLAQFGKGQAVRGVFSAAIKSWFTLPVSKAAKSNIVLIINTILYLRTQCPPSGSSMVDRIKWLDIDPPAIASVAAKCGMYKTALLLIEGMVSETAPPSMSRSQASFAAARSQDGPSQELLLDIFENIDDPDAYYGISQVSSLSSVMARMEHEADGAKSLAFRGAQYDSNIRRKDPMAQEDGQALVTALGNLGLSGVASSVLQSHSGENDSNASLDNMFETARRLEQWNLPVPTMCSSSTVTVYKAYQSMFQATEVSAVKQSIQDGLSEGMGLVLAQKSYSALRGHLRSLAVLTEIDDALNARKPEFSGVLAQYESREHWMRSGRYEDIRNIMSCRETTLSLLSQRPLLRSFTNMSERDARRLEARNLLSASKIYRFHKANQQSLNLSTSLAALSKPCNELGLNIDAAVKVEVASSLWDHGEMLSSIGILQTLAANPSSLETQSVPVSLADILSRLGHHVSVARLESPDDIQRNYLKPALIELKGRHEGEDAGKVFHQFAIFCDEQLQNPDLLEDLERLKELEKGKADEVRHINKMMQEAKDSHTKRRYAVLLSRAERFLMLDQMELKRLQDARSEFLRLSIENYLQSLIASDEHSNDALRFTALWLERSEDESINAATYKHLYKVPTRKFAALMNQLSSRLQFLSTPFQQLLMDLVKRICIDHPYHGMYHIWSGTKSRPNKRDEVAISRLEATIEVAQYIETHPTVAPTWQAIDRTSRSYELLAAEGAGNYKTGAKIALKHSSCSLKLMQSLSRYRIPPPTMHLDVRADKDYSRIPMVDHLDPYMTIAGGNSAPKVITAVGTNGKMYKQLVKGGNDDLRQDAIMEQVFAAVSSLLKLHRATQQRNLSIRTYKVLPLTPIAGIIEFVDNTVPLHEFLIPTHHKYYPNDYRGHQCRKEISNVESRGVDVRVATFRKVMERFRPVMRFFFMEHFLDPDEWFSRRLAYTRTTATISIVGHILGIGDRHGHNILLDMTSGEVVHIDLGVAFETGRVLPIPEVVPFRLTRDIVDGMGVTKTEGVFRRCCEFTLDALREETYSIMTILDVLRYDPLYSWSISPIRMAKLQDAHREENGGVNDGTDIGAAGRRKGGLVSEESEAERALAVVRKKLSKTLSVAATVNDLINQATDDRNLAVLFSGWGAYA